jgi:hypothetical protein
MAERSIFDDLVAELSVQERRNLLENIAKSAPVSEEPLFKILPDRSKGKSQDYAARAAALSFLPRVVLAIRGILTGKSKELLLREDDLRDIAKRIDLRFPGLIDRRHGLLLAPVAEELRKLRDSARFFYDLLDRSVEKDKAAFFAFLASIEMPELHRRLVEETDPFKTASHDAEESALRGAMLDAFDEAIVDMDEIGRRAMYRDLRSLIFLKRLSGFLFERLLGTFRPSLGPEGSDAAAFAESRDLLLDLGDILFSMAEPPSTKLLEALFVFVEREGIAKPDAESILSADIARAEAALGRIRSFNAKVPMGELCRLASSEPAYLPRELAGGEDWLVIFKAFWRDRIESLVNEWKAERRYSELAEEIAAFVGDPGPAGFAHIFREETDASPPVRQDATLSFLDAFFRGTFQRDIVRPLKLVLVDGEFYRKDNRIEYTDAYDGIARVSDTIAAFDARLGPQGEIGSAWAQAKAEMSPAQVKHRKLQMIARNAEDEAERIIRATAESLSAMVKILGGIMKGEAGGRYDSLANLSYLDGKSNKDFTRSLGVAKDRCERAITFLAELSGLDLKMSA